MHPQKQPTYQNRGGVEGLLLFDCFVCLDLCMNYYCKKNHILSFQVGHSAGLGSFPSGLNTLRTSPGSSAFRNMLAWLARCPGPGLRLLSLFNFTCFVYFRILGAKITGCIVCTRSAPSPKRRRRSWRVRSGLSCSMRMRRPPCPRV